MEKQLIPSKAVSQKQRIIAKTGKSEAEYYAFATEVGQKMHINKLDQVICQKLSIYTVAHLAKLATQMPSGISEKEANGYLLEHSINPYEIAKLWRDAKFEAELWTCKESTIANGLTFFPKTDFERYGDRNHLIDVSRSWFDKDGINLDVQAAEMSEKSGFEVSVQDIIDFVAKYRPKRYMNPAELLVKKIELRWKEVTGFVVKEYYVEHLLKMCELANVATEKAPF